MFETFWVANLNAQNQHSLGNVLMGHCWPLFSLFRLSNTNLIQLIVNTICRCLDSNCGSMLSETTALPQPLSCISEHYTGTGSLHSYHLAFGRLRLIIHHWMNLFNHNCKIVNLKTSCKTVSNKLGKEKAKFKLPQVREKSVSASFEPKRKEGNSNGLSVDQCDQMLK